MTETAFDSASLSFGARVREARDHSSFLHWLIYREVRTRYRNAVLGLAWAVLQPLATVLVVAGFFRQVSAVRSSAQDFVLFTACGVVPWLFFSKSTAAAAQSFLTYAEIVKKNHFPRVYVPLTFVLAHAVDLFVGLAALGVWLVLAGQAPSIAGLALVVAGTAWLLAASLGFSLVLAPLQVRFRDIGYALSFALQGFFFLSPVLFSVHQVSGIWKLAAMLNPLTGVLVLYRAGFLGQSVDPGFLIPSAACTLAVLGGGVCYFSKVERDLSDRL